MRATRVRAGMLLAAATLALGAALMPVEANAQYPTYIRFDEKSSLRVHVAPREAEVFVDGHYVGLVDSFDGFFQRLHVPAGNRIIEVYLDGYETLEERMHFVAGETYKVDGQLTPLPDGAPALSRPQPSAPLYRPAAPAPRPPVSPPPPPASVDPRGFGTLVVRIQPIDAVVLVDGERWRGHETTGELVLDLGTGRHQLTISRDGYRPYTVDVDIATDETTRINVSLPRTEEL